MAEKTCGGLLGHQLACAILNVIPPRDAAVMHGNDAWSAVAELAASQHGAFHRSQAAEIGLTTRQLRRAATKGLLRRSTSQVFVYLSNPVTTRQNLIVASLAGAVASHRSAAMLHKLDGASSKVVEVTVARGSEISLAGVVVHRSSAHESCDVTTVDGIRCTSIARTLAELGAVVSDDVVEQALDSSLRRGVSARWIEETHNRLWRPGPCGGGALARVIRNPRRRRELPESWLETLVERLVTAGGLPAPTLQHEVVLESGPRRMDLAFPEIRLGIEGHSRRFHFGPLREEADNLRDLQFAAAGWELIYVTWAMLEEPDYLMELIRSAYAHRVRNAA